jgi:hypothetical protein
MPRSPWMLLPLALLACGGEGTLTIRDRGGQRTGAGGAGDGLAGAPTIPAAGSGGSAGQTGGQGGDAGAPITPIRTVHQRNPFGNVAASDNLLWDGDFEWSGAFLAQYAWSSGKSWKTSGGPEIEVLAACHSGMKCARVKKGGSIGGIGVSRGHRRLGSPGGSKSNPVKHAPRLSSTYPPALVPTNSRSPLSRPAPSRTEKAGATTRQSAPPSTRHRACSC